MQEYPIQEYRSIKIKYLESVIITVMNKFDIPKHKIFEGSEIDFKHLGHNNFSISPKSFIQLCKNIVTLTHSRHIGIEIGRQMDICLLKELGLVLISSLDLWDSLNFVIKKVNQDLSTFKFNIYYENKQGIIQLNVFKDTSPVDFFIAELCFSYIANIFHYLKIPHKELIEYQFNHKIDPTIIKDGKFGRITYGDSNRIIIPRIMLHAASPLADEATQNSAQLMCEQSLYSVEKMDIQEKIRKILSDSEQQVPTLETVAERLYSTPWTVSRRLKRLGTSYQNLVDEARISKASHLLLNSDLKISDIAQHLGYSDVSSFRRAFKRWFGVSPRLFRSQELLERNMLHVMS